MRRDAANDGMLDVPGVDRRWNDHRHADRRADRRSTRGADYAAGSAVSAPRQPSMAKTLMRAIRVLLVEDDRAARDGYVGYLTAHGFDVLPAANGHEAMLFAGTSGLDVIVLDLGLPDIDGWEVARRLKANSSTMTIPIIALTAAELPHERASAMRAGCDWHLAKPCAPADLLYAIHRSIGEPM